MIVDKQINKVLGKGYNRMPRGCEELSWDDNILMPLESKYPYGVRNVIYIFVCSYCLAYIHILHIVLHGAKAAIFDGLMNGKKLKGAVLYTTLFPANSDAQWIAECGIKEVVYMDNMFKTKLFSEASRKIFKACGITFRYVLQ